MPDQIQNQIDLETAQRWAKKWRKEEGTYNNHNHVHAFFIPLEDITQLLQQGVDGLRAYIGVDDDNVEKLMIVGTQYNEVMETQDDMLPGTGSLHTGNIYDFTRPCPSYCGYNSPLNILPKPE